MDILITAPSGLVAYARKHPENFPGVTGMYSDPAGHKLGSGGGTVNVLWEHYLRSEVAKRRDSEKRKRRILPEGKRIIIHSDGQSRRLPAYAPIGKSFIPFPVFKWGRGQRIDQTLFDIQLPLLEKILVAAPKGLNTLVASGDALVWTDAFLEKIPQADVVCIGIWAQPETASKHGVFVCPRHDPFSLHHMLQKPPMETLQALTGDFLYLLDAGIWLLSDLAVETLFKATGWDTVKQQFNGKFPGYYDLYSDFGSKLGNYDLCSDFNSDDEKPGTIKRKLSVRIFPMEKAEFFHFGSNSDLLKSTSTIHNRVIDQREIWHKKIKSNPNIFVQNSVTKIPFGPAHSTIWIENSYIPETWKIHNHNIITGIPENNWHMELPAGICMDFIPVRTNAWCLRPYGFNDIFRGKIRDQATTWLNQPVMKWFEERLFTEKEIIAFSGNDIYESPLFPVVNESDISEGFIQWLIAAAANPGTTSSAGQTLHPGTMSSARQYKNKWLKARKLSSADIIKKANHSRKAAQRKKNIEASLEALAKNHRQSIFYQLDLKQLAGEFRKARLQLPELVEAPADVMTRIHDLMFRSAFWEHQSGKKSAEYSNLAFGLLREGMLENIRDRKLRPLINIQPDQIHWGRSPVRLDLAGGWTDTPPYCILYGGRVVNMAVELNGQPPIQVYIRPTDKPEIVIHSIDLGFSEIVRSYKDVSAFNGAGSPFAIPKAALMLSGYHPAYSVQPYKSLKDQLKDSGGGLDISLMVAVPKGSGLGTSSILAATILGGLSDCCSIGWDKYEVAYRALLMEQLLTTGGGWQDQLGGIFEGVKLIESQPGLVQRPSIRWAPDHLFRQPDTSSLVLLYYTGITRLARHILSGIVQGMFLNSVNHLGILSEMKQLANNTYEAILNHDWEGLTSAVRHSWELNQRLDSGTKPPEIAAILHLISDYIVSCKLLGAGGGGYLIIFAKDTESVNHIKNILNDHPPNSRARFVDWQLSARGLEITKS